MATLTVTVPPTPTSPPLPDLPSSKPWRTSSSSASASGQSAYASARATPVPATPLQSATTPLPADDPLPPDQPSVNPYHVLSQKVEHSSQPTPVVYRVSPQKVDIRPAPPAKEGAVRRVAREVMEGVEDVVGVGVGGGGGAGRKELGLSLNTKMRELPPLPPGAPPSPPPSVGTSEADDEPSLSPLPARPIYHSEVSSSPTTSAVPSSYTPTPIPSTALTSPSPRSVSAENRTRRPSASTSSDRARRPSASSDRARRPSASSSTYPRILRNDEPLDELPPSHPLSVPASTSTPPSSHHPLPLTSSPEPLPSKPSYLSPADAYSLPTTTTRTPARRNTTGTSSPTTPRPTRALIRAHQTHLSTNSPLSLSHPYPFPSSPTTIDDPQLLQYPQGVDPESELELDSDILKRAEQIRRERKLARAREAEAEAQAGSSNAGPLSMTMQVRAETEEGKAIVGNLVGEKHPNYILMYNMLTGIRIGVSRCQAKIKRDLTDEDYTARHKYSFDIVGNELTPSARYDFKFKDYAPWVFRELRDECFHLDPADYLLSLTSKYILTELGSPGKSGSFFYFSSDYRFIIKTIHHAEHKFLRSILKQYHEHVRANPHTLISRFYGLHRVKLPHGRKIHFVIMNNLFPPHRDIHETYDLKGSTVGRLLPPEIIAANPRAVLKDLNWIERGKMLELGPEKAALFKEQVRRDAEFLKGVGVMDYSLLVGIHNMERGNRDNVRRNTLHVVQPDVIPMRRKPSSMKHPAPLPSAAHMRRAIRQSEVKPVESHTNLSEAHCAERKEFWFYRDEGGYRATDERDGVMDTIYYLGIIDVLTPWTWGKKVEGWWKGMTADRHKISPVPSHEYGDRFVRFLTAIIRGGEGGEKFKPVEKHHANGHGKEKVE